jgi:uncharacterized protein YndB with AHSA1/START domain
MATHIKDPTVQCQLLIRKPVAEVFQAFIDPAVTTKFWFTKSSGKLAPGAELTWEWEMYGAVAKVRVKAIEPDQRILIEWNEPPRPVEWKFTARPEGTMVVITTWGFSGSDDQIVDVAIDNKGGFTSLLAAAKAWLEHGIELNLVGDHHPDAHKR